MANAASLSGLMCRILLLTSVAYEDTNQITLEFSTPRFLNPPSMFFCFTSTNFVVTRQTVTVISLSEGGSIFSTTETFLFPSSHLTGSSYLDDIEVSTVYEVLGTDPYYAGSYKSQRYDDLINDQQGISIKGMVDFPNTTTAEASYYSEQSGNCFLLTGNWKANTRYQMTINVVNPSPPAATEAPWPPPPPPPPVSRSPPPGHSNRTQPPSPPRPPPRPPDSIIFRSDNSTPILWMLPVSTDVTTYGNATVFTQTLLFSVRGSKYGAACPLRSAIVTTMAAMFDACAESRKRGLGPPLGVTATVSACLALLRRVANQTGNRGVLPFTAPPLTSYNLSSFRQTSCNGANSVLGPRFGGECISCGVYGIKQNNTCICPSSVLPNLVGSVACGSPITPDGSVTSLSALPAWLCDRMTEAQTDWETKQLLDHIVAKQYVDAFTKLASPLLDQAAVFQAFQTFNATLIFDDRRPQSPTRTHGLKPNCDECTDGEFKDVYTKAMVPIFDWHFGAMNTFRFLGYVLDTVLKSPCPALWDSSNPKDWRYGYYNQIICKPMPTNTCCGDNFDGRSEL